MTSLLPPPILLRPKDGYMEHVMICTLCHELPLDPVVTPCNHMFCRVCIGKALQHRSECPNDRARLTTSSLKPIDGVLRRVWEQIGVKCPACDWTGTVGNYKNHVEKCVQQIDATTVADYQQRIENLKRMHQRKIKAMESSFKEQIEALARTHERDVEQARAEQLLQCKKDMKENMQILVPRLEAVWEKEKRAVWAKEALEKYDPNYQYTSFRVIELTQLICRNLENLPAGIDRNRIYNCVKRCMDDLRANYDDNPPFLYNNVRMLLGVCNASTWFTERQGNNFYQWSTECEGF